MSGSAAKDTTASLLTSCLAEVLLQDLEYATCVMNSGLFTVTAGATWDSLPGITGLAAALSNGSNETRAFANELLSGSRRSDIEYGTCKLLCTAPTMTGASSSCCEAAANIRACESTNTDIAVCKEVLEDAFALKNQCGISSENVGLIIGSCIIFALVMAMVFMAKWHARQQGKKTLEALEARLSAGVMNKWAAFLGAWNQIVNLVWKNVVLRRRKPLALLAEQLLPVVLVTGLVFLSNLDTIFPNEFVRKTNTNTEAIFPGSAILLCTDLEELDEEEIGTPSDTMTTFYTSGQSVLGMFLLISYIKFVSTNTTTMVIEKETRIREVMKIMGLSDATLLFSWALTSMLLSTPLAFAIGAELKFGKVFPSTEYATLVFLFWSFSLSIVAFSYFITPFFNKSRTASIASVLLWLILYFPFFAVQAKTNARKYTAALSPPTAFALAVDELLRRAQRGTGFAYSIALLERPITVPSAFAMSWMLLLDAFILFALGWYLEQVLPQQYGVRKPWNFLFKLEYWSSKKESSLTSGAMPLPSVPSPSGNDSPRCEYSPVMDERQARFQGSRQSSDESVVFLKEQTTLHDFVEPVTAALAVQERKGTCLQIKDLRKVFNVEDGEKVAVHHLNLTMYSGQITALLGHNGAGKTTTISMLTGLIPPTSGDATLFGRSIRNDFNELRQIMGICPQHDVLFSDLTVLEHLLLFGTMKNIAPQQLASEAEKMIREVGLTEKRHVAVKNLSGGQKRKLSVALAFIGDSKLVFLDEPTSGMDPYSRRFTWNLLQRNREDRVIVLTTHFMDEADILGDRIAIMADGLLCCAGSSLFLKNRYGTGYNLTIMKRSDCDVDQVGRFLRKFVEDVRCLSNYGSEVVFQLPSSAAGAFPSLLQTLDQEMYNLGVQQYGVSVTTLEEVFLRISRDREDGKFTGDGFHAVDQIRKTSATSTQSRPTTTRISSIITHQPTLWAQYSSLTMKRFRISKRDRKSMVNAICIPVLFFIILAVLPQINVANFLPDYTITYATESEQGNCTAANFTSIPFTRDDRASCLSNDFSYCSLGLLDCDASVCCTQRNIASPYYPCNTCLPEGTTPCYNPQCLAPNGARLQLTLNAFITSLVVMLAFAFVPASIVAFVVREKNPIQNAKILQLICGANISAYWFANWTHDILVILVSVSIACIVTPLSSRTLSGSSEILGIAALVVSHAAAVVPLAYLFSFRFNKHAVAQTSLLVFALSTGGLLSIFSFLCRLVDFDLSPNTRGGLSLSVLDRNYLRWVFMLFPGYSLNSGIYEIATRALGRDSLFGVVDKTPSSFFGLFEGLGAEECDLCWESNVPGCCSRSVFQLDVAGAPVLYMAAEALIFTILVFIMESGSIHWKREHAPRQTSLDEDDDVTMERRKVQGTRPNRNDAIFIRNLRQQYSGGKVALDDLCLAIPKGECFGYLGINGAGKSTTMKVLTGQIAPSNGFVTLGGYDLSKHRDKARTIVGYCPQFDSLHDLLTVEEQLELYARLKGIPSDQVRDAVDQKIAEVGLNEYRNKLTRGLSGGNKRKVSTAIALMGSPQIIFLDEPSTGVDPSSRRKMWDVIASVCAEKESCVVLTTHSMEECEALSTRVGILVSGKLKCLGTVGHLKQKFGKGYTVEVKLSDPPAHIVQRIQQEMIALLGPDTPVTSDTVLRVSAALGMEQRGRAVLDNQGNAWVMNAVLSSMGHIPVDVFANWWCSETMSQALVQFFRREFAGSKLVEQQSDHFRFQVPKQSLRPHMIFHLLEESKARLYVGEYSVSDTSLEHIFNNMAAQQDEEQLISNTMYDELAIGGYGDYNLEPSSLQSVRSFHRSSSLRRSSFLG